MSWQEPHQGWLEVNGVRLHYWDWPGAEPALPCMHGVSSNDRYWDTLAEAWRVGTGSSRWICAGAD